MNNNDAKTEYADIFYLPHRQSTSRKHMSLNDRAAQFAPFAALSGFEDMIAEEARPTDSGIELSENEAESINRTVCEIMLELNNGEHPFVTVTYFEPDARKKGGSYETAASMVKRVDTLNKELILYGSGNICDRRIPTNNILIERIISIFIQNPSA